MLCVVLLFLSHLCCSRKASKTQSSCYLQLIVTLCCGVDKRSVMLSDVHVILNPSVIVCCSGKVFQTHVLPILAGCYLPVLPLIVILQLVLILAASDVKNKPQLVPFVIMQSVVRQRQHARFRCCNARRTRRCWSINFSTPNLILSCYLNSKICQ